MRWIAGIMAGMTLAIAGVGNAQAATPVEPTGTITISDAYVKDGRCYVDAQGWWQGEGGVAFQVNADNRFVDEQMWKARTEYGVTIDLGDSLGTHVIKVTSVHGSWRVTPEKTVDCGTKAPPPPTIIYVEKPVLVPVFVPVPCPCSCKKIVHATVSMRNGHVGPRMTRVIIRVNGKQVWRSNGRSWKRETVDRQIDLSGAGDHAKVSVLASVVIGKRHVTRRVVKVLDCKSDPVTHFNLGVFGPKKK